MVHVGLMELLFQFIGASDCTDLSIHHDGNAVAIFSLVHIVGCHEHGNPATGRLTSPQFMALYDRILAPEGQVEFKTDNMGLFDYSLESIPEAGWTITASTKDLHHSDMAEGNIMTEYEAKFSAMGNPICKLIAVRHGESNR